MTDFIIKKLPCGYTPIDLDTFAMDNGNTKKELVGRTYTGVDGYCPLAVYLGTLGYCLELALRPGVQHWARETGYNLERTLPMATALFKTPLLVRADSGFCSLALMQNITTEAAALSRDVTPAGPVHPQRARWTGAPRCQEFVQVEFKHPPVCTVEDFEFSTS